jgi:hypothetical protein
MHWLDYIIVLILFLSVGCLSIIQVRKTRKFGPFKSLGQELDAFDIRVLRISGLLFIVFAALLVSRLFK